MKSFITFIIILFSSFALLSAQITDVDIRLGNVEKTGCPDALTNICLDVQFKSSDVNSDSFGVGGSSFVVDYGEALFAPNYEPNPLFNDNDNYITAVTIIESNKLFSVGIEYVGENSVLLLQGNEEESWTSIGTICLETEGGGEEAGIDFFPITTVVNPDFEDLSLNNNFPEGEGYNAPLDCNEVELVCAFLDDEQLIAQSEVCSSNDLELLDGGVYDNDFEGGSVTWHYSTNADFDPYLEGTAIESNGLPENLSCDPMNFFFKARLDGLIDCQDTSEAFEVTIYPAPFEVVTSQLDCSTPFVNVLSIDGDSCYEASGNDPNENCLVPITFDFAWIAFEDTGCSQLIEESITPDCSAIEIPTPTVDGTFTICENSTTTVIASGEFSNYEWYNEEGTIVAGGSEVVFTQGGNYEIIGFSTEYTGCEFSNTFTIESIPAPDPIGIDGDLSFGENDETTLIGPEGYDSYEWTDTDGNFISNLEEIIVDTYGEFTLTVTTDEGCTLSATVETSQNVGIEDIKNQAISLYPNPATSQINILLNDIDQVEAWQIFDIKGRLITEGMINGNQFQINTNTFSTGIYLIQLTGNNNTFTKKFEIK